MVELGPSDFKAHIVSLQSMFLKMSGLDGPELHTYNF